VKSPKIDYTMCHPVTGDEHLYINNEMVFTDEAAKIIEDLISGVLAYRELLIWIDKNYPEWEHAEILNNCNELLEKAGCVSE